MELLFAFCVGEWEFCICVGVWEKGSFIFLLGKIRQGGKGAWKWFYLCVFQYSCMEIHLKLPLKILPASLSRLLLFSHSQFHIFLLNSYLFSPSLTFSSSSSPSFSYTFFHDLFYVQHLFCFIYFFFSFFSLLYLFHFNWEVFCGNCSLFLNACVHHCDEFVSHQKSSLVLSASLLNSFVLLQGKKKRKRR